MNFRRRRFLACQSRPGCTNDDARWAWIRGCGWHPGLQVAVMHSPTIDEQGADEEPPGPVRGLGGRVTSHVALVDERSHGLNSRGA